MCAIMQMNTPDVWKVNLYWTIWCPATRFHEEVIERRIKEHDDWMTKQAIRAKPEAQANERSRCQMVRATRRKEIRGIHEYYLRAPRHIVDGEELNPTVQQTSPVLVAGRAGTRREKLISPPAPPPRTFTTIDKATHWATRIAMRPLAPPDQTFRTSKR
jgi:hypothetical protein